MRMTQAIPGTKLAPLARERLPVGDGFWWLAAGLAFGAAVLLLRTPFAPEVLIGAGILSVGIALVVARRYEEAAAAAPNGADVGTTTLPPRAR